MPEAKVTKKASATNKSPEFTLMDHVMSNVDIGAIVAANKPALEKIIAKKIKEVIEDYDWSNLLYDAIDSGAVTQTLSARLNEAILGAMTPRR